MGRGEGGGYTLYGIMRRVEGDSIFFTGAVIGKFQPDCNATVFTMRPNAMVQWLNQSQLEEQEGEGCYIVTLVLLHDRYSPEWAIVEYSTSEEQRTMSIVVCIMQHGAFGNL